VITKTAAPGHHVAEALHWEALLAESSPDHFGTCLLQHTTCCLATVASNFLVDPDIIWYLSLLCFEVVNLLCCLLGLISVHRFRSTVVHSMAESLVATGCLSGSQ
jgi:hypothetical protein